MTDAEVRLKFQRLRKQVSDLYDSGAALESFAEPLGEIRLLKELYPEV